MYPRSTKSHHAIPSMLMLLTIVLTCFSSAPVPTAHASGVIYVKPGGAGTQDGLSWANAKNLAAALGAATTGDELWVATGTYTPTVRTNPAASRSATFTLLNGVAIYGGFAGIDTETLATRDWTTNVVTLSGDIGNVGLSTDNSYNVVTGATGATLDGVTISEGNADMGSGCPGTICGGGMYNYGSSPTLTNVTFRGNRAVSGGGMSNGGGSSPTLTNVTFNGNSASFNGGGMYNYSSSPTLINVTFSGNDSSSNGGGMDNSSSSPTLTNVTFSGNRSSASGGGMSNDVGSNPTLTNVTFSGNRASTSGGGMSNITNSNPQIRNSIIWGNTATTDANLSNSTSTPSFSTTLMQGSGGSGGWVAIFGTDGGGNLDSESKFVTPIAATSAPTTTGDYRLQATSPAINTGDNTVITTTTDLDGNSRISGGTVDMGAYELQFPPTVQSIVRADPNPTNADTVIFTITFSVNVSGVDATDFVLTKTDGQNAAGTQISSVSSSATSTTTWIVTVITTDLVSGTIRLDLVDNDSIVTGDTTPVPLGGSGTGNGDFSTGEVYTVDRRAPTVTLTSSANSATISSTIVVTVTFSEAVTGFVQADLTLGNATASTFTPVSGSVYTFTLTPTANGAVTVDVAAGVAANAAKNGNRAATTFSVTYAQSSTNADLSNLTLSTGTLSPTFAATTTNYTATVPYTVTNLTVTPIVSDTTATVKVKGVAVASGSASGNLALSVGANVIPVVVTAGNGTTTKTYTIIVIRAGQANVGVEQTYKLVKGATTTAQPTSLAAISNTLTLTITVSNAGPDAVTGIVVTDTFPDAAAGTVWTWTCVGAGGAVCGNASGTGNLNETLGLLPKNGSVTFVVTGSLLNPNNWKNTPGLVTPTGVTNAGNANPPATVGNFLTFVPLVVK